MKHNKYIITAYQHDKTISAVINMQYALWLDCICKNNLDLIYIHNVKRQCITMVHTNEIIKFMNVPQQL